MDKIKELNVIKLLLKDKIWSKVYGYIYDNLSSKFKIYKLNYKILFFCLNQIPSIYIIE